MPQNITHLVLDALGTTASPPTAGDELLALLQQWRTYFGTTAAAPSTTSADLTALSTLLSTLHAAPDRAQTLDLLKRASENPLYGLILIIACIPGTGRREVQRFWDMLFTEQSAAGGIAGWKVKTLPAPAPASGRRYLIISDLHRDATTDDRGLLQPGSIDHFKVNATLYERILDFAMNGGYTLLEGGDCEELWFVRSVADYPKKPDGTLDVAAKLQEIINSHPNVYLKLRQLHHANRYFRIYGNHDSFLKPAGTDNSIGQVLKTAMEQRPPGVTTPAVPFEIYDAFVIDDVKTMMEHDVLELGTQVADFVTLQTTRQQFIDALLQGRLGLDSNDYTEKRRMLVTHGHQFDFWNSPENEILGLLIANTVATFVDRNMDPFLDLRGIALEGNPLVNFGDLFSKWFVFNSWPARQAAIRFAHQTQHTPNDQRQLVDSIMFSETRAMLFGTFGMALNWRNPAGAEVTPQQSRQNLDLTTPSGLYEYLSRHCLHHLCIGHTHNPQSQPSCSLKNLAAASGPLSPIVNGVKALLPDLLEPEVKTMYFNSGTAGWMEGVIWAIEIDETGQARLIFWTDNSVNPEYMDWELRPLGISDSVLLQGLTTAFKAPITELELYVGDIYSKLRDRLAQLNVAPAATAAALARAAVVPIYTLAMALLSSAPARGLQQLKEVPKTLQQKIETLRNEHDKIRSFMLDVVLSMKRRALQGFGSATAPEWDQFVIRAPISAGARARLERFKRVLKSMNTNDDEALHYAGLLLSIFDEFPRNLPFYSTIAEPLNPMAPLLESDAPVLHALLGTLWIYPPKGQTVRIGDIALTSEFAVEATEVRLTVWIDKYGFSRTPVA